MWTPWHTFSGAERESLRASSVDWVFWFKFSFGHVPLRPGAAAPRCHLAVAIAPSLALPSLTVTLPPLRNIAPPSQPAVKLIKDLTISCRAKQSGSRAHYFGRRATVTNNSLKSRVDHHNIMPNSHQHHPTIVQKPSKIA